MKASNLLSLLIFCLVVTSPKLMAFDAELNAILLESSDLMQEGKVMEALALLQANQKNFSQSREFMNNLAVAYLGNNDPENALSILRQLVEIDPLYSIITHNLIEMERQIAGAGADKVSPVLFVQTVESFFDEELGQVAEKRTTIAPQTGLADRTNSPDFSSTNVVSVLPARATRQTASNTIEESDHSSGSPDKSSLSAEGSLSTEGSPLAEGSLPAKGSLSAEGSPLANGAPFVDPDLLNRVISDLVLSWAASWANRDFDGYISHYSDSFIGPKNQNIESWRAERQPKVTRVGKLSVVIDKLEIQTLTPENIVVDFDQAYKSATYQDKIRKQFHLVKEVLGWKIQRELTLRTY